MAGLLGRIQEDQGEVPIVLIRSSDKRETDTFMVSSFFNFPLRVPYHFPHMPVGVLEIACVAAPKRVVSLLDDNGRGPVSDPTIQA